MNFFWLPLVQIILKTTWVCSCSECSSVNIHISCKTQMWGFKSQALSDSPGFAAGEHPCSVAWLETSWTAKGRHHPWEHHGVESLPCLFPGFPCSAICNSRIPWQSTHMGYLAIAVDRTQTQAKRRNVQAGQRIPLLTGSASWSHQCLSPLYISTFIWTVKTARVGMDPHLERDHSFVN